MRHFRASFQLPGVIQLILFSHFTQSILTSKDKFNHISKYSSISLRFIISELIFKQTKHKIRLNSSKKLAHIKALLFPSGKSSK